MKRLHFSSQFCLTRDGNYVEILIKTEFQNPSYWQIRKLMEYIAWFKTTQKFNFILPWKGYHSLLYSISFYFIYFLNVHMTSYAFSLSLLIFLSFPISHYLYIFCKNKRSRFKWNFTIFLFVFLILHSHSINLSSSFLEQLLISPSLFSLSFLSISVSYHTPSLSFQSRPSFIPTFYTLQSWNTKHLNLIFDIFIINPLRPDIFLEEI